MNKLIMTLMSLFALVFITGCTTEGTISGNVTDTNGVALEAANVSAISSKGVIQVTTDAKGNYTLEGIPLNQAIEITTSKESFVTFLSSVTLTKDTTTITHNIVLESDIVVVNGTVNGVITDVSGAAIVGATVFSGTTQTITDAQGKYTLALQANNTTSITVSMKNYSQNNRVVAVVAEQTTALDMTLVVVDVIESFNADEGLEVSTKGATITLPTAYTLEDGTSYSGIVTAKISYNRVTTVQGNKAFPGDYMGLQTDGTQTVLQSYGFIDVTLEDTTGNALQLAAGALATLTYPMDDNIDETPTTIPLWYYDIVQGIWVEDGVATYDVDTNTYTGNVSHFTTWNLDRKFDGAELNGCIEDINGIRIPTAQIFISGAGWSKNRLNNDTSGKFSFINAPSNLPMTIFSKLGDTVSEPLVVTLAAGEVRNIPECLTVNTDISEIYASVTGKVFNSEGKALENVYVSVKSGTSHDTVTGKDGSFISEQFLRPLDNKVDITFTLNEGGKDITITQTFLLSELNNLTDIGTIELKSTHVLACLLDENGDLFEYTGERGGNVIIDTPYVPAREDYKFVESGTGYFDLYLPLDSKKHTIYAFGNFEESSVSKEFIANQTIIDLRSECLQLVPVVKNTIQTTITIIDYAGKDLTLNVEHSTRDIENTYGFPGFYGDTLATDVNTTTLDSLEEGNYLISLRLPYDQALDFTGVKVHIVIEGQIDQVITVPAGLTSDLWGGDWFFFKVEVFQGKATIKIVNIVGNVPV